VCSSDLREGAALAPKDAAALCAAAVDVLTDLIADRLPESGEVEASAAPFAQTEEG
jgi:hypothetical protein